MLLAAALLALLLTAPPSLASEDPLLDDQVALTDPALLGAEQAWAHSTGHGIVVAVLDTGVRTDHPDLRSRLWINPGEVAGNGADDDANGFVDDVHGANLIDGSGDITDQQGHGTHVAGLVGAAANNGIGGSGIAPGSRLMIVKVLDANASGTGAALAAGIRYAVAGGARILNVPLNSDVRSPAVEDAVAEAGAAGATIVASAGNGRRDVDAAPSYPASLPGDHVVTVGATRANHRMWAGSNRGAHTVDVAAPGVGVLSTARGGGYEERSGTSMASSYAAGALALLAAARPDLGQADLRRALLQSTRRRAVLRGLVRGGELNVAAAMRRVKPGASRRIVRSRTPSGARSGRVTLRWSAPRTPFITGWRVSVDGRTVAQLGADRPLRVHTRVRPGSHRWRVVALSASRSRIAGDGGRFRTRRTPGLPGR
jgi:subtilisin family serine protease